MRHLQHSTRYTDKWIIRLTTDKQCNDNDASPRLGLVTWQLFHPVAGDVFWACTLATPGKYCWTIVCSSCEWFCHQGRWRAQITVGNHVINYHCLILTLSHDLSWAINFKSCMQKIQQSAASKLEQLRTKQINLLPDSVTYKGYQYLLAQKFYQDTLVA